MAAVRAERRLVGSRTIRYLEAGQGRPVVLLHSFPLHAEQWRFQLEHVPAGWRFIAPDLPGFGPGADDGDPVLTVDGHAEQVMALLNELGIDAASVVGVSMGGYVAFGLVRLAASRVSALVLADTRAEADTPEARARRDRMLELIDREGVEALAPEMLPNLLGATTRRERPEVVSEVTRLINGNSAMAVRAAVQALRDRPDSRPLLAGIRCPTLLLCGEEDTITPPEASEAMQRAISGARLQLLPGAGHLSNLEDPGAFSRALEDFLG